MSRIVVIGGVAAGMSAASQAKRRAPGAEVVVFERGRHVSYGACGMPYNIEQPERPIESLVVITPERFREERGIDVRIRHEVVGVDPARKVLTVKALETGEVREERWDRLVIATGASAARPPIPGLERPGVFTLRTLEDGAQVKQHLAEAGAKRAVIVGAGYIGLEMAEILRARGLEVTLLERLPQVAPGYEPEIVEAIGAELARHEVRVETGVTVEQIAEGPGGGLEVATDRGAFAADLVLVSTGVRPNVEVARLAGVALGPTGAIAVDEAMRTDVADVFAAGDCAEAVNLVTGEPVWMPLGTTANKQGKVAGANAAGADERFGGIVGSSAFKVFDLEVARTGLGAAEIARLGLQAVRAPSAHRSRAHGVRGSREVRTVLFAERDGGRLLGAQMVGDTVAKRVDVFAAALHGRMTVAQVEAFDLTYAPPIAPVYDPILIAAGVASKALEKARRD